MKLTAEQFDQLVKLSGLTVEPGGREKLQKDMESILGYVEQLQGLYVEEAGHAAGALQPDAWREDVVVPACEEERGGVLEQFPFMGESGGLKVPGVIGRDT